MILFFRFVPLLTACISAFLFWWQQRFPESYPYLVGLACVWVVLISFVMTWRRVRVRDVLERMAPTFTLFLALSFGVVLSEGLWANGVIIALAAVSSFLSLELLFVLAFDPSAYPMNGLSRLNIAYIPLATWYAVSTSLGFILFLHTDRWVHVVLTVVLGFVFFWSTRHPSSTGREQWRWTMLGGVLGLEIGLMGLLLPLSLGVQGLLAAFAFIAPLRARRYLYPPKPSRRFAWCEGVGFLLALLAILLSAKWL